MREAQEKHLNPRQMNGTTGNSTGSRFLTSATQSKNPFMSTQESIWPLVEYAVNSLPDVNFDIGEMYSGLIPIDSSNASRALFFIFEPTVGQPVDEVTIWLNGGPGCSSLEGFFQENGRFLWQPGTYLPVENP